MDSDGRSGHFAFHFVSHFVRGQPRDGDQVEDDVS